MRSLLLCIILVSCIGCASVTKQKVDFKPTDESEILQTNKLTHLWLDTGYSRTIEINSKWSLVGSISNKNIQGGKVYKPVNDVLTIEGTQIYEAYLVVSNGKIVGFYLPASSKYSPLKNQVEFP
ncbi:hypothetical protein [Kaarinaea lacus]